MPGNFVHLILGCNSFFGVSLGISPYKVMTSTKRHSFDSPFSIWMTFINPSCLIALGRTCSAMLNANGENGHPCLFPDLRGKA